MESIRRTELIIFLINNAQAAKRQVPKLNYTDSVKLKGHDEKLVNEVSFKLEQNQNDQNRNLYNTDSRDFFLAKKYGYLNKR